MSAVRGNTVGTVPADGGFDDIRVGVVSTINLSPTSESDASQLLPAIVHSPPVSDAQASAIQWQKGARPKSADARIEGVVTRWKPIRKRGRGNLHQDYRLIDADGRVLESARVTWDVPAGAEAKDEESAARIAWDVGTVAWGEHVAAGLAINREFISAVDTFDGTIGVRAGEEQVEFRLYRGAVIEVSKKTLDGPTFTVTGSERAWIDLLSSPTNDFVSRTRGGDFRAIGNNFQYLRLFRAFMLMVDEMQLAASKEMPSA